MELVNNNNISFNSNLKVFKEVLKKSTRDKYIFDWHANVLDHIKNPKCRFYAKFKFKFKMEPYLDRIDNYYLRKSMARFRTSSHALNIECARYKKKELNIMEYNRHLLCADCLELEDESHFLLSCFRYSNLREELFKLPFFDNVEFNTANSDDKIMYILNITDTYHLNRIAKFIHSSFLIHSDRIDLEML